MPRSKSSNRWLQEHFADIFVKRALTEGYRSRAVYKLQEIDKKEQLIKPGMVIIDLGAAPGSWSEYVGRKLQGNGTVIALDKLEMEALPGVHTICGDFQEEVVLEQLQSLIKVRTVDLILSDMAPNMSGTAEIDIPRAMHLAELALDFAESMLKPEGTLFMKLFIGRGFESLVQLARQKFKKVVIRKPLASRARSRETYLLAKGYTL